MYPKDFDGIVAGSPGAYWIGRATQAIWVAQAVHQTPESEIPAEKYKFIHESVLKACDRLDGVEDGVIEDPTKCHFDPKTTWRCCIRSIAALRRPSPPSAE